VQWRLRLPPKRLASLVDFESRLLKMLHDPLGEHLTGIVRRVFREEPTQQSTTARDREPD
jgi:hypothetical protein